MHTVVAELQVLLPFAHKELLIQMSNYKILSNATNVQVENTAKMDKL